MKQKRMSLATIEKLSRADMKKIMAGDKDWGSAGCATSLSWCDTGNCNFSDGSVGSCRRNTAQTKCYCVSGGVIGDP
jgi:hypothetical protein